MSEQTADTEKKFSMRDLLGIKDYRNLWLGHIVSNIGDSMTSLALLLLVNKEQISAKRMVGELRAGLKVIL